MKVSLFLFAAIASSAAAFTAAPSAGSVRNTLTRQYMFGGAGAGVPNEDNPEEMKAMEQQAKQMGMSLEEYKLGVSARVRMVEQLNAIRVTAGSPDKVAIERDGNNPPKFMEITITDEGKALGKENVSQELVKALKTASDSSRSSRMEAQKTMMMFIQEEIKKLS